MSELRNISTYCKPGAKERLPICLVFDQESPLDDWELQDEGSGIRGRRKVV